MLCVNRILISFKSKFSVSIFLSIAFNMSTFTQNAQNFTVDNKDLFELVH